MRGAAVALFILSGASAALAETPNARIFSNGPNFAEQTGESLFANVCQACHMKDGKGAVGAGRYPPLTNNPKLEAAGYPIFVITHGLDGMPPVGAMMSDAQVAAVVNYVRTHFGNAFTGKVSAEDVARVRQ